MKRHSGRVIEKRRAATSSRAVIRAWVNKCPEELSKAIIGNTPSLGMLNPRLHWVSPLKNKKYAEYGDQDFLRAIGHPELADQLHEFWPQRGLHWDALAVVESEDGKERIGVVLVDAKSHPKELFSKGTKAKGEALAREQQALRHTAQHWLRMGYTRAKQFGDGSLYESASRLAHLYFLNDVAHVPAWLVNIYFNPHQPKDRNPWSPFLTPEVYSALGMGENDKKPHITELFMTAKP